MDPRLILLIIPLLSIFGAFIYYLDVVTGREEPDCGAAFCYIVFFPIISPIVLMVILINHDNIRTDLINQTKVWWSKYGNLDYISIFLPVICIFTLFLLE